MRNIGKTVLLASILMAAAACNEKNDVPSPVPAEEGTGSISWKGETSPVATTLYEFRANRFCVYVSQDEIASLEELDVHDHCTVAMIPVLLGTEFDIMEEKSTFAVAHYDAQLQDFDLYAAPGDNEGISSGYCRVELNEESGYLVVDCVLQTEGGESLSVYDSLACSFNLPDVAGNYIMCYDAKKPVNAAFYDDTTPGKLGIWLTPSAIDWFEVGHVGYNDINDVVSYLCLYVPDDNLPESLTDIQNYDGEFTLVYMNREKDLNNPLLIQLTEENRSSAEGIISLSRAEGENSYNALVDITAGGEHIAANFTGQCRSVTDKPEIIYANSVTCGDDTFAIGSVIVDRGAQQTDEAIDVWICAAAGVTDLTAMQANSPILLDNYPLRWLGDAQNEYYAGFSANRAMSVSYGGTTWSGDLGSVGTAMLKDLGDGQYYVKFWNNPDISFEWMGPVTVIE